MHTTVSAAGGSLLIPAPSDLLWGAVAFVVIFGLFAWKVIPRMNTLLDERAAAIGGRIDEAKHARQEADALLERYQQQLADARIEAGRIREGAREDAKQIRAELVEQAQAEAARIVAQGNAQVEANRAKAEAELRNGVGALALSLASGVIGEHLENDENSTAYVDRFLADLEVGRGVAR
jgi:F-type H+-transporting ATPase subunit b